MENEREYQRIRILLSIKKTDEMKEEIKQKNIKLAEFGAAVEWHQDWAFYPHTNDDILAVGVMLDDCTADNGPLLVVPGSHKGPIWDHHADGLFCGALNPAATDLDYGASE